MLAFCLQFNLKIFVEVLSNESWRFRVAYLADIFYELHFFNRGMQGKKENILTSTDKTKAIQKKIDNLEETCSCGERGNVF